MQNKLYKGSIVEESLEDNIVLNDFNVEKMSITQDKDPKDRWHIFSVKATREQIENLSKIIKSKKFYAHFWDENNNIIVVFRDKIFEFYFNDKEGQQKAIDYGLSVDIPYEQMNFLIK